MSAGEKVTRRRHFTMLPDALVDDLRVDPLTIRLWVRLDRYAGRDGGVMPSRARLAMNLGVSEATVKRAYANALDTGWISRERVGSSNVWNTVLNDESHAPAGSGERTRGRPPEGGTVTRERVTGDPLTGNGVTSESHNGSPVTRKRVTDDPIKGSRMTRPRKETKEETKPTPPHPPTPPATGPRYDSTPGDGPTLITAPGRPPHLGPDPVEARARREREDDTGIAPRAGHRVHPAEPNALAWLTRLIAERQLPLPADELLDHAYRLGHGDPWTGRIPIASATERDLGGIHDPRQAIRARLRDAHPVTTTDILATQTHDELSAQMRAAERAAWRPARGTLRSMVAARAADRPPRPENVRPEGATLGRRLPRPPARCQAPQEGRTGDNSPPRAGGGTSTPDKPSETDLARLERERARQLAELARLTASQEQAEASA